ncbi:MAG: hypothetical protein BalsKO_31710 [Balneolaceae bacterium]
MTNQLKKLTFLAFVLFISTNLYAQVPQGFNFQAMARGTDGIPLINQELGVQVSVLKGSDTGESVYLENHTVITNPVGLIQLVIGEGTPSEGNDFSTVDWASDNYFVKLEIDPAGGTEYEELGVSRLLSVPYALLAENVINSVTNGNTFEDVITINTDDTNFQDSLKIIRLGSETEEEIAYGLEIEASSTGRNRPLTATINEDIGNGGSQYAISGTASGPGTGTHIGMLGTAWNPEATGGNRFGMYGQANSLSKYNYGVNGVALGTGNGDQGEGFGVGSINFGLYGYASGNSWSNIGLEARNDGEFGQANYGVSGLSSAGSTDSTKNYGVAGRASGPGINYGVYGAAWDGAENYAGFFDGDVTVNGDLNYSGALNNTSDRRLKENIQPLESGLSTIMKLNPTTYNFRGNGEYNGLKLSTGLHYGLIAQEVEQVLPSLVKDNVHTYTESVNEPSGPNQSNGDEVVKSMDYKTMNYTELIPVLIKAVQEQQEEIKKLQKEIEKLRSEKK